MSRNHNAIATTNFSGFFRKLGLEVTCLYYWNRYGPTPSRVQCYGVVEPYLLHKFRRGRRTTDGTILFVLRMAANSRLSKLSEKEDECVFTWKLFTGWDYMIGNSETAQNRVSSLVLGFKEALLEEAEKKREDRK